MYWCSVLFYSALYLTSTAHGFIVGGPVNTTSGTVTGKASSLRSDVSEYLGIRYAKAPKGDLRFAAPVPVERSLVMLNATSYSPYVILPTSSENMFHLS
ncbi:hypothetical protein FE257_003333 [Aspergillus nanangensis]|uniref:Carboxylesterase type B domain-containing protein n=1 Tax=Aspergillus nanangensis TaxID=2582783 RepID=A0AAD4CSX8_ASPNN|nr:hypothetical protein FE257_003333 [Aspergillus nanangensis]